MARIHFLSDLHTEYEDFENPKVEADVTILAGDTYTKNRLVRWDNARNFFGHTTIAIAGNHEFYSKGSIDTNIPKLKELAIQKDIHFLENEEIICAGVRFLGCTLWADFRLFAGDDINKAKMDAIHCVGDRYSERNNDFWSIRVARDQYRKFKPLDSVRLFEQSVSWLISRLETKFDGPTVIITHHLPSRKCLPDKLKDKRMSAGDASNLDWLIEKYQPNIWVWGHVHEAVPHFKIGNTQMISNPRGCSPDFLNKNFDPKLVIEV